MSQQNDSGVKAFTATAALARYRRVKLSSGSGTAVEYAGAADKAIGVVQEAVAITLAASVRLLTRSKTFIVTAAGAFSAGARLYAAADGKVDDVNTGGELVGYALGAASADGDEVEALLLVDQEAPAHTKTIWVDGDRQDDYTADGSEARPYKTLATAWAVITATRNILRLKAATYAPTAALALPAHDLFVIGEDGNDTVIIEASAANIFSKAAGALTATTSYHFENLMIEHGDTYKGIVIDNTTAGKKIIVTVRNCEFGGSANAIDVATHGDASNAVRLVVDNDNMEIEGPVNFAVGNNGDYIRITDAKLSGGLVTNTSATVMEIFLDKCEVLHEGVTGGATQQVLNVKACHSRTGATIAAFDSSDAAGSHTDNILTV